MRYKKKITVYCLLLTVYCLLSGVTVWAQEEVPESLRLPEVVITGIDQSKIQRELSKVVSQSPLPEITQSSRDRSERLVQEGDLLYLTYPEQTEELYTRAIALDSSNSRAYLRLGDVYRVLSRYADAAKAYQKSLEVSANLPEAHYKLGILYEAQLSEPLKAIKHYRAYLQLEGADPRVRIWLRNLERKEVTRQL